jgi:hypothetical protein
VLKSRLSPSHRLLLARAAVLIGIVVLVCVPGLTRMGQKLETASRTPSFAKNIDCPPKKVTVLPVAGVASTMTLRMLDTLAAVRLAPPPDTAPAYDSFRSAPRSLRGPPSRFLS